MDIGEIEHLTQNRIVKLFQDRLGYQYLGNWEDRLNNSNIPCLMQLLDEKLLQAENGSIS